MSGMSLIVKSITRLLTGFITVFGIYIVCGGHISPGGGFSGGVILACAFILLTLAFGKDFSLQIISRKKASVWDSFGAIMFLLIAVFGIAYGGYFFQNFLSKGTPFRLWSGGTILLSNIGIGIKVGACLFGIFIALAIFRRGEVKKEEEI